MPTASDAGIELMPPEIVERPPPGLARGAWEAPAWAFPVAAAMLVLVALGALAWRRRAAQRRTR